MSRQIPINFSLLESAIKQKGPWVGKDIIVSPKWFLQELSSKIINIDWQDAKKDVARFLKPQELVTLDLWSENFFLSRMDKLARYL